MKIKTMILSAIFFITAALIISNTSFAVGQVIIWNNSDYDLKYKRSDNKGHITEGLLLANYKRTFPKDEKISIRREGKGSSLLSSWYDVTEKVLRDNDKNTGFMTNWFNPNKFLTIIIEPTYTGWNFGIEWQDKASQ
jgi:hypothetical protein